MTSTLVFMDGLETYLKLLGRRIQEIRKPTRISQEKVGQRIGRSRTYVGYIEQGKRRASIKTLWDIAQVLNVSPNDFFDFAWPPVDAMVEYQSDKDPNKD